MDNFKDSFLSDNYLAKKIGEDYVLWFRQCNQWVVFNKQQWFVFELYLKRTSFEKAIEAYSDCFKITINEGAQLVDNIYASLDKLFSPDFELPDFTQDVEESRQYKVSKNKSRYYRFKDKTFSIIYGSSFLEEYIHLPLSYLETTEKLHDVFEWELFPFQKRYALRDKLSNVNYTADEPGQIKRLLYIQLASYFYDINPDEWLAFIHGSAVKMNNNIVLFSSASGNGKSTVATILQNHGYSFFSDDFIPVDMHKRFAYPFPAAPCIKKSGTAVISNEGFDEYIKSSAGTMYIEPLQNMDNIEPAEIKSVIFVCYKQGAKTSFKPVNMIDALSLFLEESWVADNMPGAKVFINWFMNLKFFKLEFENNNDVVEVLNTHMRDG